MLLSSLKNLFKTLYIYILFILLRYRVALNLLGCIKLINELKALHVLKKKKANIRNRYVYTMGCPTVRGDNPGALASGLSYVQVDKHGITIYDLYHLHQCRLCTA